jgi:diguanylate cyclase (GGDEF)-like protein
VLLYIDLDDFKPINDQHGHPVGDQVLIEVGRRISSVIGPHDVVGRLGGDEFAVIVAGTNDPSEGRDVADRIVQAIRMPLLVDGLRLTVQGSVGVAVGAQPLIPAVLVRQADEALYQAKQIGKNRVCLAR